MAEETIVAISSPPGGGARAVLRLSGPGAGSAVGARFSERVGSRPLSTVQTVASGKPKGVYFGDFDDGIGPIPCFWFWMPGPASFTREDVSELHIPGSPALVESALSVLLQGGVRLAQPGEFIRRAFQNGRIDLTRAEGVLGLIEAADLAAARASAALLFGGLADRVAALRESLDSLRAMAEASLDFDTTETGHIETAALMSRVEAISDALTEVLAWEERRQSSHGRPRVVLAGRPNAGKSSLFNLLAESSPESAFPALVSDFSGSTRDGKSALWLVAGVELEIFDAPGFDLAESVDFSVSASTNYARDDPNLKAQVLARVTRGGADVILWLWPSDDLPMDAEPEDDFAKLPAKAIILPVFTKVDLESQAVRFQAVTASVGLGVPIHISVASQPDSARTLLESSVALALGLTPSPSASVSATASLGRELSARHRVALSRSLEALTDVSTQLRSGWPLDLVAERLRDATERLDEISGRTTPEDLLDRIFSGFCLGK